MARGGLGGMDPRVVRTACIALSGLALLGAGCGRPAEQLPAATRGYILISVDTLRADHLGCYGYHRDTSPFLDSLAARGALFENAIVQYPNTLASHMSILTGLYPGEHGVYPPRSVLSRKIETLPQTFRRHGFRTAGFTEGGFMRGRYGFARGFEEFEDRCEGLPTDVETTLDRGLNFLSNLGPEERFLLFLHTYSVHAPYAPPEPYAERYWKDPPPGSFSPTARALVRFNAEGGSLSESTLAYFEALYDAGINYVDDQLRDFFASLEGLGLSEEVTVLLFSDHGEEFLEHGALSHTQSYHENLRIPLIVLHPQRGQGVRVRELVQSIDLAPTLYELARLSPGTEPSGRSLAGFLAGPLRQVEQKEAFAENRPPERLQQRSLYRQTEEGLYQLVVSEMPTDVWIGRSLSFDTTDPELRFEVTSFENPRDLSILVDGELRRSLVIDTDWSLVRMEMAHPDRGHTVTLRSGSCSVPAGIVDERQWRCYSFKLRGLSPRRLELYDLSRDSTGSSNLFRQIPRLGNLLTSRLSTYVWQAVPASQDQPLDSDLESRLKALGYLQ